MTIESAHTRTGRQICVGRVRQIDIYAAPHHSPERSSHTEVANLKIVTTDIAVAGMLHLSLPEASDRIAREREETAHRRVREEAELPSVEVWAGKRYEFVVSDYVRIVILAR